MINQDEINVYELYKKIMLDKLVLYKKKDVCQVSDAVNFIETLLLGIIILPIFIDASCSNKWTVLDGNKRLNAIKKFLNNDFALNNLKFFHTFNGMYFNELPKNVKYKIQTSIFTIFLIHQGINKNDKIKLIQLLT